MEGRPRQTYGGEEDPLAYGEYHGNDPVEIAPEEGDFEGGDGERGIVGDTYRKLRGKYQGGTSDGSSKPAGGLGSFIFHKLHDAVNDIGSKLDPNLVAGAGSTHSNTYGGTQYGDGPPTNPQHRYGSFATQQIGNDVKWYVDGCGYMWAVSRALQQAKSSIWILDCKILDIRFA